MLPQPPLLFCSNLGISIDWDDKDSYSLSRILQCPGPGTGGGGDLQGRGRAELISEPAGICIILVFLLANQSLCFSCQCKDLELEEK